MLNSKQEMLPECDVAGIMFDVLGVVAHCHSRGVLYRGVGGGQGHYGGGQGASLPCLATASPLLRPLNLPCLLLLPHHCYGL